MRIDGWLKEIAPSDKLRKWFKHDPIKWNEFQKRYCVELQTKPENWRELLKTARGGNVTLLFSAHDLEHNNAMVLKLFLEEQLKKH